MAMCDQLHVAIEPESDFNFHVHPSGESPKGPGFTLSWSVCENKDVAAINSVLYEPARVSRHLAIVTTCVRAGGLGSGFPFDFGPAWMVNQHEVSAFTRKCMGETSC